ncbi:transglycosylase SLT domain-containing protein [Streptomyces yaanensis]|uniref:Transglycosylase SLT domain-containing protein n=1 Tax=Streptomyces yaanensis TaxID=1142239 RepID=A0ABV7SKU7_9ACTN|nr:transglycosylase SLT domain-containing protein [Streptomyces sp. CGMCC 4.7035]WNB97511.1 transglycosylase SLT domain-containing protein [Streptomyces sp. CGMCC 4.7035]
MSRISVRGFAVASATAVTAVGAVTGVASGSTGSPSNDAEATAADLTLLADIPAGQQAQVQTASLTQQADAQAIQADASAKKDAEAAARKAAADTAVAKKEAAEKAAKERAEAKAAASRSKSIFLQQSSYTVAQVQAIARQIVPADQFQCFSTIVNHESTWNYRATNPSSGAYGLVQALPASKMASAGADWQTNPATQIKWGLNYMNVRYGSPCGAWSYWQVHHSY